MTYEERKKQETIQRYRLARWPVLISTLYWIVYIVGAQLGYEARFPLGPEIIRLENREKAEFLEPSVPPAVSASTPIYDPRKQKRFPIEEQPRTFAFAVSLSGPWALGLDPDFALSVNPRVELLDADGRLLANNSASPYYWKPFPGARHYRSESDEDRRKQNSHGAGLTHDLDAGTTYLLRVSPEANQDYYHSAYSGDGMKRERNTYDLIIRPYRPADPYPLIPLVLLIGVPIVYFFFLFRLSFRLAKEEGQTAAGLKTGERFSDFKTRVEQARKQNKP
ncbi:hypothetical protein JCM14469_36410 [Desulfatiferula olefinivorans]